MAAPATGNKKKKQQKMKGKTLNLNEFLGDSSGPGTSYVLANKPVSWADEMENQDEPEDMGDYGGPPARHINRAALPTAPRAARGPDVDMDKVPTEPPFTAFLGNLPFDVSEEEIERFFNGLTITNIRIPPGRTKGFGYAEFEDRQTLIQALSLNDEQIRNRKVRIDLADQHQGGDRDRDRDGYGRGGNEDDGRDPERAEGDWRRKDPSDAGESRFASRDIRYYNNDSRDSRDSGGRWGDRDSNRGFGDRDRGYGDRDRGYGGDRDRYGGRDSYGDRDRGFGGDRDRGFGGDRDRGYGGDRDRGYGGDRDRGYGGDRDRGFGGDRDRGFGGGRDRYGDRDRGFGGDRDGYGGGRKSFGSGFRNDRDRYSRDDRGYDRDRGYSRRDDDIPSNESSDATRRPRLNLQPRTKPVEEVAKQAPPERSSSIFGAAKPVDTAAREREIEQKLQRERDADHDRDRVSSSQSDSREQRGSRSRQDSDSDRGSINGPSGGGRRERKLSSSSSGKGMRTVAPPPGVGSARVRRDSALSDNEDVFEDDSKVTSPKSPPAKKEDVKLVPAPPPSVNIWAKRKEEKQHSEPSGGSPQSPPQKSNSSSQRDVEDSNKENNEAPRIKQNVSASQPPKESAWSKGKPDFIPAEAPKENPWAKRHTDSTPPKREEDTSFSGSHWGSNKPRGGSGVGGGRGLGSQRGGRGRGVATRGRGSTTDESRSSREKTLPKSLDEMPKKEEYIEKDWSDQNKFSTLMGSEDGAEYSDN